MRRPWTRSSLTNVPLVERPSSSTVQTPSIGSSVAWLRETWASHVSGMPAAGVRPMVIAVSGSGNELLSAVAVAQLDERPSPSLRREPRLQLGRTGRMSIAPIGHRSRHSTDAGALARVESRHG